MLNPTKTLAERFEEAYRKPVPYEGLISDESDILEAIDSATDDATAHQENLLSAALRKPAPAR
jgi:hypothetical protein